MGKVGMASLADAKSGNVARWGDAGLMPWADPIPDRLLTGLKTTAPDETGRAKRTWACCDRAFIPYVGSSAPAIYYARAGNRRVAPRTAKPESCCSSRDEARKDNR